MQSRWTPGLPPRSSHPPHHLRAMRLIEAKALDAKPLFQVVLDAEGLSSSFDSTNSHDDLERFLHTPRSDIFVVPDSSIEEVANDHS